MKKVILIVLMVGSVLLTGCTTTIATKLQSKEKVVVDAPIAQEKAEAPVVQVQKDASVVQTQVVVEPAMVCSQLPQPQCVVRTPCSKCGRVHGGQPVIYQVQPVMYQDGGRVHYERTKYFH